MSGVRIALCILMMQIMGVNPGGWGIYPPNPHTLFGPGGWSIGSSPRILHVVKEINNKQIICEKQAKGKNLVCLNIYCLFVLFFSSLL